MDITYKDYNILALEQVKNLYQDAKWDLYLNDIKNTMSGIQKSTTVFSAWDHHQLVGMIRALCDDHTICYIQDILVLEKYRNQGIGKALIEKVMKKHQNVNRFVLTTDIEGPNEFYRQLGFKAVKEYQMMSYIKMRND